MSERQLDLTMVATGAEDSQIWNHPMSGTDDRDHLLGGKKSILVQRLVRRQLMASAEQTLQIFLSHMTVAGGNIHHQARRAIRKCRRLRPWACPAPFDRVAHEAFH